MNITVYGKNIQLTEALKNSATKKLGRLDKFFDGDVDVKVVLNVEKKKQKVEVTIPYGGRILRAEEATDDMYESIDEAVESLEGQLRKHKTRILNKKHAGESIKFDSFESWTDEDDAYKIVKTKKFAIKPMSVEEAILQMNLVKHDFFVFLNAESEEVNVVYKRKDGNYGLIEPEF